MLADTLLVMFNCPLILLLSEETKYISGEASNPAGLAKTHEIVKVLPADGTPDVDVVKLTDDNPTTRKIYSM